MDTGSAATYISIYRYIAISNLQYDMTYIVENSLSIEQFSHYLHRRINGITGKKHPNIYELVELFQTEQASTEVTIEQLQAGGTTRRRGKFYRIKDRSIQKIKEKFNNGTYIMEEYIEHLSKWMGFL